MMKKLLSILALSTTLMSCDVAMNIYSGLRDQNTDAKGQNADAPQKELTRSMVNKSGLAMIRATKNNKGWDYFIALSDQNGTHSFGEKGRVTFSFRGGLVIGSYVVGNDLLGVKPNAQDPIQFQRPFGQWPEKISRIYELPGEGINGDQRLVECRYEKLGDGRIEIIEQFHQTQLIAEKCKGDGLKFENRYMIDQGGFVWKSEQWVGLNPDQVQIEIIEPID